MFGLFRKRQPAEPGASRIVPRIKHTNFLAALRELGTGPEDTPVTEPLVADLVVAYAFDLGETFEMVCPHHCQRLGIAHGQLRGIATANLRKQVKGMQIESLADGTLPVPVLRLLTGNEFEACLLLLDEIWDSLTTRIPPDMVVAVPTRDIVFVTSSQSAEALQILRESTEEAYRGETTHNLTQQLLVRRGRTWEVFSRAKNDPLEGPTFLSIRDPSLPGKEVFLFSDEDAGLAAAVEEARRRIPELKVFLDSPQAGVTVHVPWVCGEIHEVYEASLVGRNGDELEVEFTPDYAGGPVRKNYRMDEILDWTVYHQNGQKSGGFTTRALQNPRKPSSPSGT